MAYFFVIAITCALAYFIKPVHSPTAYSLKRRASGYGILYVKKNCGVKFLCILIPLVVSAIRFEVGTDFRGTYYGGFKRVLAGSDADKFEIGFKYIIRFLGKISSNPQILIAFCSAVFVVFVWKAIYEQSPDVAFSIFLVFITRYYFISMNIIRQFVGMALILYGTRYILKGKKIKFIAIVVLAGLLHESLFLCLAYALVDKINFTKSRLIGLITVSAALFALSHTSVITNLARVILIKTRFYRHLSNVDLYVGTKFAIYTFSVNLLILLILYFSKADTSGICFKAYFNTQVFTFLCCILITGQ